MFTFGSRSRIQLETCHPALQAVARRALELSSVDFIVTEGYRGREAQEQAFANGFSLLHFGQSPHNHAPSLALDVVPYPVDWKDIAKFEAIAVAFKQAAGELGVALQWGGDFHRFVDRPHFQIKEPAAGNWSVATAAMLVTAASDTATDAIEPALATREDLALLTPEALLARVIWGECRGVDAKEARAIAHVAANRAARPRWWGHTVMEVCLAPKQFSCLNPGDPNFPKILKGDFRDGSWANCRQEAGDALAGRSADPTGGAVSYHATGMKKYPYWIDELKFTAEIGSHLFYALK